ncbi:gp436 family protein [Aulosira sp. FACHB-615]|uniref:gp436 family protein n=1 Tax=Aulosira sp. FACHB-615 TaxID=2692777 RepID=UPI0016848716|nr:DUF1320 domain-containing protein [Aulosira sp. FACHB-615]MBD2492475.1 DUF1320 domain-containing protein [Aulosira sp. FACHB-615]
MSYATVEEFTSVIGNQETVELTNLDNPSATTVNSDRLQQVLEDASGEIDGYLATRYATPLEFIPSTIRTYCVDIAWYRLAQNNAPEQFATRYNNAIARLKDIEKGIMVLLDPTGFPLPKRLETNPLVDDRGNLLDDWSVAYVPGGEANLTRELLNVQDIYRY